MAPLQQIYKHHAALYQELVKDLKRDFEDVGKRWIIIDGVLQQWPYTTGRMPLVCCCEKSRPPMWSLIMTLGLELELFPLVHITLSNCFFILIIHQMKVVPLSLNWVGIFIKLQRGKQVQQIVLIDQQLWHHLDRSRIGETTESQQRDAGTKSSRHLPSGVACGVQSCCFQPKLTSRADR